MLGTVKFVDGEKGFGFIKGDDGREYFVHRSACKNFKLADLEVGQEVTFEDAEGSKGLRAEDVYV